MLTITPIFPRAVEIVAEGRFTGADVALALDRMAQLLDEMPRIDILADEHWVRVLSRIEGALIPGVHYEVYGREHAAHARA